MDENKSPNPKRSGSPRRRKRSKMQIFKESYLPVIIAGAAVLMIVIFIVGSVSRGISRRKAQKEAIVKAFCFLNSDELNSAIYAKGGMIPYKADLIANTKVLVDQPQWGQFGDIANYTSVCLYPDSVLPLEGDNYATVFSAVVHGATEWTDAMVKDLEDRYNAAYAKAKADPDIDTSIYAYNYDRSLG